MSSAECMSRLRLRRIALGLCPKCGLRQPRPNRSTCTECGIRYSCYESAARSRRTASGLCVDCKAPTTRYQRCMTCRAKHRKETKA